MKRTLLAFLAGILCCIPFLSAQPATTKPASPLDVPYIPAKGEWIALMSTADALFFGKNISMQVAYTAPNQFSIVGEYPPNLNERIVDGQIQRVKDCLRYHLHTSGLDKTDIRIVIKVKATPGIEFR